MCGASQPARNAGWEALYLNEDLLCQQFPHNMRVQLLAFSAPLAAHGFSLFFVRDGELQSDEDGLSLPDLAVNDVVLIGALIVVGGRAHFLAEAEFVLL